MAAKVAAEFSTSVSYAVNDLCLYGGVLYRFTSAHSAGAWNTNHVAAVDNATEQQTTRILAGMGNAEKASDYADTVVFEPSQIAGTRYKYVLTSAQDPRM